MDEVQYQRLRQLGQMGDSFDDVVKKMLDEVEEMKDKEETRGKEIAIKNC